MTTSRNLWAMEAGQLSHISQRLASLSRLVNAGMGPMDQAGAAAFGERTITADISGDTATVDAIGVILAHATWIEYLYAGPVVDPYQLASCLNGLASDPGITRVVIRMDSPGGTTDGTDLAAAAVRRLVDAGKVVEVRASGCLASAAYWIASQATSIVASPTTLIGSIGCYVVLADTSTAMANNGITLHLVSSGDNKGLGADGVINDAAKAEWQTIVSAIADEFRSAVAVGRGLNATIVAGLGTGQVWLADQAMALGLIDAVDGLPASSPVSSSVSSSPSAASAASTGASMAIDHKTLAALIASNPTHAVAISAAAADGKDGPAIESMLADQAKADAQAAIVAERDQLKAERDQLTAKLSDQDAAHQAQIAALNADLAKATAVAGIAQSAVTDPGPSGAASAAPKATQAEYDKMRPSSKAKFHRLAGEIVG
jgi:capsid assembly protease